MTVPVSSCHSSAVAGGGSASEAGGEPADDAADRLGVGEEMVAGIGVPLRGDARRAVGLAGGVLGGGGDHLLGQAPVLEHREADLVGGAEPGAKLLAADDRAPGALGAVQRGDLVQCEVAGGE